MKSKLLFLASLFPMLLPTAPGIPIPIHGGTNFDHQENLADRWEELQAVLPLVARVKSEEGKGKHVWQEPEISPECLIANKKGQGYLLPLVVTPPVGKRLAMAVCMVTDPGCLPAGILSPEGEEIKMERSYRTAPSWLESRQWPTGCRFGAFWIPSRDLIPGKEHVLLFACRPGAPAGLSICVTFLPTEPVSYDNSWSQVSDYLGIKPMRRKRMEKLAGYRSARVISAFPSLIPQDITSPVSADKLVPGALSLDFEEPSEAWLEARNISVRSTLQPRRSAHHIQFSNDLDNCPSREDIVEVAGEPLLSVDLDSLQKHAVRDIRKDVPAPEYLTTEFDTAGLRVEYYDVLAFVTNNDSPPKAVGSWLVGEFTDGRDLSGHRTFLLPGTFVRAFMVDGKCVGLIGSFGTDQAEQLMNQDIPKGSYIERTPGGKTYATFHYDGESRWRVLAEYPGDTPRFQYRVTDDQPDGEVDIWYFGGEQMNREKK